MFFFLISVKDVTILCILVSILTFCGKKFDLSTFSYACHRYRSESAGSGSDKMMRIRPDTDRIHNTGLDYKGILCSKFQLTSHTNISVRYEGCWDEKETPGRDQNEAERSRLCQVVNSFFLLTLVFFYLDTCDILLCQFSFQSPNFLSSLLI